MKSMLLSVFVLALFLIFTSPAGADFQLMRKIPAPIMSCEAGTALIKAMASDGVYICLTRGCYVGGGARVIRIDPDDGSIVNDDYWISSVPECVLPPMPTSMSFCPYDGAFYVGTDCGAIVGLAWQAADSAWFFNSFAMAELSDPSSMAPGQYSFLFAADRADTNLVQFESIGSFMDENPLDGILNPVAMATFNENLFVLDADNGYIVEMTIGAANVDTHYVDDWGDLVLNGTFEPEAATFIGEHLYLAGNEDSIHIYEMVEKLSYREPAPEGDNVVVVVIPDEVVITFDTVTDSGDVTVEVGETDDCAPPAGVTLFAEYYDISTDATFEYIAEVALLDSVYPPGLDEDLVRVFSRPSDTCGVWRDITTAPVEEIPVLKILRRSKSEDDEFSIFAMGEDNRTPQEVVEYKIADLQGHILSAGDSIPVDSYDALLGILDTTENLYYTGQTGSAVQAIDMAEDVVREDALIPHTYDPADPGRNVAGRVISRAKTLEFSLGFSESTRYYSGAAVTPENIHIGLRFPWLRAFIEVPGVLNAAEVDVDHIYLQNSVRAIPESVMVFDYDTDGAPEIMALFPGTAAQLALASGGCNTLARMSCFVSGFELHSVADVEVTEPSVEIADDGALLSGTGARVDWQRLDCAEGQLYRLAFSPDGGDTWEVIADGLAARQYEWIVPDIETEVGLLRVACGAVAGDGVAMFSRLLTIESGAGSDVEPAADFRLALRPNPSSSAVEIEFASPMGERASVAVYSVRGELVKNLFSGRMAPGSNKVVWEGDNESGNPVSAGTYFVVLRAESETVTKKLIMQR